MRAISIERLSTMRQDERLRHSAQFPRAETYDDVLLGTLSYVSHFTHPDLHIVGLCYSGLASTKAEVRFDGGVDVESNTVLLNTRCLMLYSPLPSPRVAEATNTIRHAATLHATR